MGVSQETVKDMAIGARKLLKTDFAVATSVSPDQMVDRDKASGNQLDSSCFRKEVICEKHVFRNDRNTNINRFTLAALNLLRNR